MSALRRRKVVLGGQVMGVDASLSGTGIWFSGEGMGYKLKCGELRGVQRLIELKRALVNTIGDREVETLVIEGYAFASKHRGQSLAEWGGIVKSTAVECGILRIIVVAPATLKKFVIGHAKAGQSGKDVMRESTCERWGIDIADDDVCDAHGLMQAGIVLTRGIGLTVDFTTLQKAQQEIVTEP